MLEPKDPIAPGRIPPTLLSPDEKCLFVALSNADAVAAVDTARDKSSILLYQPSRTGACRNVSQALAQSADGTRLFVADSSLNAVAVFDSGRVDETGNLFSSASRGPRLHSHRLVSQRAGGRMETIC